MANTVLKVEGMTCGHCAASVEKAVSDAGATGKVDLAGKKVSVEYDEKKVSLGAVKAAIEEQGYDVV
ncbi:cation transporter [Paenibacillus arenilitoris]|uniref:Heavy-metal-associated domain-containing protein n=1 Tax=Paenibacillus arenilitoris TaxID=2772299 RepID=A0A927CKF4_9BACL|nr:cation transporter [Paenibacillus arenilitoris]MBD2869184.1 heavy-metal-associated domain-containing protein [Paenibacillus arenilitoris]